MAPASSSVSSNARFNSSSSSSSSSNIHSSLNAGLNSGSNSGFNPAALSRPGLPPRLVQLPDGPPAMRQPAREQREFSFDTLFEDNHSDRLESPQQWLRSLPPLASALYQLSLAPLSDSSCTERAQQAIRHGADPCATDPRYGRSVLHWSCMLARPVLVDLLLQHGAAAQLDQCDVHGLTPLGCTQALRHEPGGAAVVKQLLSAGASLHSLSRRGVELLHLQDLDVPLAQQLLAAGVPVDGDHQSAHNGTPLLSACRNGLWATAFVLLEGGADVCRRTAQGMSVLHFSGLPLWFADQLLQYGADINASDDDGITPLILACDQQNLPLVRCLVEAGASTQGIPDGYLRAMGLPGASGD